MKRILEVIHTALSGLIKGLEAGNIPIELAPYELGLLNHRLAQLANWHGEEEVKASAKIASRIEGLAHEELADGHALIVCLTVLADELQGIRESLERTESVWDGDDLPTGPLGVGAPGGPQ